MPLTISHFQSTQPQRHTPKPRSRLTLPRVADFLENSVLWNRSLSSGDGSLGRSVRCGEPGQSRRGPNESGVPDKYIQPMLEALIREAQGPSILLVPRPVRPVIRTSDPQNGPATDQRGLARLLPNALTTGPRHRSLGHNEAAFFKVRGTTSLPWIRRDRWWITASRLPHRI